MISWLKWLLGHVKAWFQVLMGVSASETLQVRMDDPPVTAALGPIDRLLSQLQSLEGYKHNLPVELSANQIGLLIKHLREFRNPMEKLAEMEDTSFIDKWWMKEVRDLCYDAEDYLDEVMVQYGVGAPRTWTRLLLEDVRIPAPLGRIAGVIIFWIHCKFRWRPQLSHFVARAEVLKGRCPSSVDKEIKAGISLNREIKADVSLKEENRADIKTLTALLVEMLAFDVKQKQLKVVSICGFEGAGKTMLATAVYAKYKRRFQCWAFVRVSRNPDIRSILISILSQIKAPPASPPMSRVQDLILSISAHLKTKRYFVVIDDIRRTSVWDIISRALPCDNGGSRIIITTESEHVASACSGYYLGSTIFQMDALCTDAITSQEKKKKDIKLRYNNLPLHLKTCLLFFGMHPEGCTVIKNNLVKQWVAEGFIPALKRQDTDEIPHNKRKEILEISQYKTEEIAAVPQDQSEEIAHGYFDELVTRGMVQPVDRNHKGEVFSCTVHHNVLDLIRYNSKEDNFVVVVDNLESTLGHPDIVRRLSVQFGCEKGASIPESIILSQVRSLAFYGFLECVPSLADYGLLRVLIMSIWADEDSIFDITGIGELYHLRYLKIECNVTIRLPSKIQRLQHLGTLELDAEVVAIPSDIGHLQNLLHVRCPSKADVRDLADLTNLLDLQLTWTTLENLEDDMECLCSILEKLSSLRCLALIPASGSCSVPANPSRMCILCDSFLMVSPASANLERLELSRRCCIFSRLPEWFGKLGKLCFLKIAVGNLLAEDIDILKGMPSLTVLSLYVQTRAAKMIVFGKGGFSVLRYFKFTCNVPRLEFEPGAMSNLEKLKLCFNSSIVHEHGTTRIIIIGRLLGLKEISAIIGSAGADAESEWEEAIQSDPGNPTVQLMGLNYSFDQGRGMETREGSGEDENNEAEIRDYTKLESSCLPVPARSREDRPFMSEIIRIPSDSENTDGHTAKVAIQRSPKIGGKHVLERILKEENMSFSLLRKITNDFSEKRKIGQGGYGEVYKGVLNGDEFAVKKLFSIPGLDDAAFENEFRNLRKVQHKNIIRMIGYCYEIVHRHVEYQGTLVWSEAIYRALCFEYMKGGSLANHISAESCIHDWPTTYKIINGTCKGLNHLHNGGDYKIFHLDLKPDNVLLDEELVPKIGDFGLSRLFGTSYAHQINTMKGTIGFMPQEYKHNRVVSPKTDVFSLGVIIFHMMAGAKGYGDYWDACRRPDFSPKIQQDLIESVQEYWKTKMQASEGYKWDETDQLGVTICIEMAMRCVEDDRDKRPLIKDIMGMLGELDSKIEETKRDDPKRLRQLVMMHGSQLSMLSAAESPQAPASFRLARLGSTPPAGNTEASGSGTSQVTGMTEGFGGPAGFGSFSSGAWPGASSSRTAQGFRTHSNQRELLIKRRSVNGNAHRQKVSAASQAVFGSGDPISSRVEEDQRLLERILDGAEDPRDLPLALLQDITGNFSEERKIGQGGFGEVYKGVLQNEIVAVKRISANKNTIDDKLFRRDVTSLMKLNHRNVVRFLGFSSNIYKTAIQDVHSGEILLCFEYISNGTLRQHITDELRGLEWETRYEIVTGICKGLRYLHEEKHIIHMDLKPENILLDQQGGKYMVPKITDFGLSRPGGQCYGTPGYLAPECWEDGETTSASDIHSLGVIITEIVTGYKDIPVTDNVLRRWRHRWNKPPTLLQYQQVSRCIDIAGRCREEKPEARPSISEIIRFLNESESTYGQISPPLGKDDMLGIKPLELRLPSELKEISCTIELTNDTRNCIAFNIQLPSAQYNAQPDKGIVQPESMYVVKITVQARDVHDHGHADMFIVQSMKVNEGLRDEDTTERMFENAREVVDKVNLMVVYEPPKPHEKYRNREDTIMAAGEVLEEKERKIVESVSGKVNLGNSENEEATSMGIHSSAKGQCAEETDQFNLHPLESFSRHYPTPMVFPWKESDRAVDVTRGAMGSLLDKLGKLTSEYNLEKSIKRDIESFSEDLAIVHQDLAKLEKLDGANIWVDEVRELSYNIEDMIDNFLVDGTTTHHQIDDVIRDMKNQVRAVADRKKKYNFDVTNVAANTTSQAAIDDLRNLTISEDKEELIGIETPRDEVIQLFEGDNLSKQNLKIVSIIGLGGLGKTTLAKAVYGKLQAQYHIRAFVSVGRNPDVKEVLKDIMSKLVKDFNAENMDVQQLIKKMKKFLKNKRYFLVIDDLWDSSKWGVIKLAFPRNNRGSRLLITTRNYDVALACCHPEYVYRMKPLSDEDSRRLLFRRTFCPRKDCIDTPRKKEISIGILKRCGGMPLAINSMASLLARDASDSTWEYVWKSMGAEGNNDVGTVNQILDLSYIHLPHHLKQCLLYISKYSEDREIDKNDLLRQWVAEGLVDAVSGLDAEDVAENYFKELIDMCLIQPGKIDYNNEVLSCRVHDIILDLLRSKSAEENFIHVINGSKGVTGANGQIRRVSVHNNDKDDSSILATIEGSLEHVRSVLLYRGSLVPYFLVLKYVRVLHLEDKEYSRDLLDLTGISRLFLLRYLKIACFSESAYELKLPNQIGELQQLETLDIDGGILKNYPSDIVGLPRLLHLSYGGLRGIVLPDGIDRLKSLRTLGGVCVYKSSVENIEGLGELTNLTKLQIGSRVYGQSNEETTVRMNALHSSISRISLNLRILTFGEGSTTGYQHFHGWSSTLFPGGSHIQKLDLRCCELQSCPEWIGELHHLYSLSITVREVADALGIAGRLPSLAYFCLDISTEAGEQKEESAVISGGWAFKALKHLSLYCQKVSLTFEAGVMPKLEKLELEFRYDMTLQFIPNGIEHLPASTLREICLTVAPNNMEVEGSQDWSRDVWKIYLTSEKFLKSQIEHITTVRPLLERAFKKHHPDAKVDISFEI